MKRKFVQGLYLSLLLTFFMILSAGTAFGMNQTENEKQKQKIDLLLKDQDRRIPLDLQKSIPPNGIDGDLRCGTPPMADEPNWDYDYSKFTDDQRGVISPGAGAGMTIGFTTYDLQHYGRCTRQIAWRNTQDIHITWMHKNSSNPTICYGYRGTVYQAWDATTGTIKWDPYITFGGDQLHASGERSGYPGIDAMSDGRALVYNHYDQIGIEPYTYLPTIWPDNPPLSGTWGWKQSVSSFPVEWNDSEALWPYAAFQLYDNGSVEDTIIHILARESNIESISDNNGRLAYWRRYGGGPDPSSPGLDWESHVVDTVSTIGYVVECAQEGTVTGYEGKVALTWIAPWPDIPGDAESATPNDFDFLVEQNANDIYSKISMDGGATWGDKFNVTQNDFLDKGWAPLSDLSALIDSDGRLHVVYSARQFVNTNNGSLQNPEDMDWPLFPMASRIFHWSDENASPDYISVIKDAAHDWTKFDSICMGGQWSMMSVTKPMISQCDDKLYVLFSQYQDIKNGIWDNCHMTNWTNSEYIGSANSTLHFTISDMINGGLNWDPARVLTDFTPRCDTGHTADPNDPVDPLAETVCHSHGWPSITRVGMDISTGGSFSNAVVVSDPGWNNTESPDYYLDVVYVDDLWPGALVHGEGMWAIDPIKWFRFPCVDAESQPVLTVDPVGIYLPDWSTPGVPTEYTVSMTNIGNVPLTVSDIRPEEIDNFDPAIDGWLAVDENGFSGNISEVIPGNNFDITVTINNGGIVDELYSPALLTGRIIFESDSYHGFDTLEISFIVAEEMWEPVMDIIYTEDISLAISNDNSYGCGLYDDFGQMDFHTLGPEIIDCDTCSANTNNFSHKYLYDGSPFILTNINDTRRISATVHNMDWLSSFNGFADGLRPLGSLSATPQDPTPKYLEHAVSGSADSTVGIESFYIAPQSSSSNDFIVQILKFYNLTDETIDDLFVGIVEDWDIPSDSGVRNTSDFDVNRKMMYMRGWEANQPDIFCDNDPVFGNDCNLSDMRFGGSAFFGGYQYKPAGIKFADKYEEAQGSFSFKTVSWLGDHNRGHLPAQRLYDTLSGGYYGYSPWQNAEWPTVASDDSLFCDLAMITSFGQFTLGVEDTLVFIKFLASEYQGGLAGLQETIDEARVYALNNICCHFWGVPGDADTNGKVDILDIVKIINWKYKGGSGVKWPSSDYSVNDDNCDNIMDIDSKPGVNILDIVYLINRLYKLGSEPTCPLSQL